MKGWHQDLHLILPFFLIGHVHLRKKRSVMTMHSLKVNVFRMTLKEYGSFTWVERTYPALRKHLHSHVDAPSSCPLFPLLSTYHLSRVVVLFYTLSKLFCFIVDFLTSNKVINQTKVFESVCLLKLLTPCILFFKFHTLILTLDGSSPVLGSHLCRQMRTLCSSFSLFFVVAVSQIIYNRLLII